VEPESETFSPGLRVAAAEVTGRLKVRASVLSFNNTAFNRLAEAAWTASLPAGFRPLGESPDFTVPEYLGLDANGALYRLGVRGRIARVLDGEVLAARLRGLTLAEARAALATRDGLGTPVQVEIWPSWAPRAFRLRVQEARAE
jgi:hypothetical protein